MTTSSDQQQLHHCAAGFTVIVSSWEKQAVAHVSLQCLKSKPGCEVWGNVSLCPPSNYSYPLTKKLNGILEGMPKRPPIDKEKRSMSNVPVELFDLIRVFTLSQRKKHHPWLDARGSRLYCTFCKDVATIPQNEAASSLRIQKQWVDISVQGE